MGYEVKRKTFKIGASRGITLPKAWVDYHGKGLTDEVTLIGNAILIVAPKGFEDKAKELIKKLEQREENDL